MRCLLEGHKPQRFPGQGHHQGHEFDICVECGKTWSVVDGVRSAQAIVLEPRRMAG